MAELFQIFLDMFFVPQKREDDPNTGTRTISHITYIYILCYMYYIIYHILYILYTHVTRMASRLWKSILWIRDRPCPRRVSSQNHTENPPATGRWNLSTWVWIWVISWGLRFFQITMPKGTLLVNCQFPYIDQCSTIGTYRTTIETTQFFIKSELVKWQMMAPTGSKKGNHQFMFMCIDL